MILTNQLLERQQGTLTELEANIQRALTNANDDGTASMAGDDRASLASWVSSELATTERQIIATTSMQSGEEAIAQKEGEEELVGEGIPTSLLSSDVVPPADIPKFYMGDDDEDDEGEMEAGYEGGDILQEDLALSNDEGDTEAAVGEDDEEHAGLI